MANTTDNNADKLRFAGDVNVERVTITSLISNKTFNVANQLLTIQIFEDMFSPFITGSLIFQESLDFASNFPFVGEEVIDLKLFTPTLDKAKPKEGVIEGRFYIYKMADREEIAERSTVYQLHFISIEAIADINTKISKGYKGKISSIVEDIIKGDFGLQTDKPVNIETTSNKTRYISNFWSPVKNINFCADRALNQKEAPTYIFFENRDGFNFVSLDKLNEQNVSQEFVYNNSSDPIKEGGGSNRNLEQDYKRITEFHVPVTHDYMDKVTSGAYGSQMLFMDLSTKKYYNLKYSMFNDWGKDGKEKRLNEFPVASNKIYTTYRSTMFKDNIETGVFTDYGDVSTARVIQARVARLKQAESFKIQIVVSGRTDYTVGKVVDVKMYKSEPIKNSDSDEDILDNITSGKYLISSINHVVDREKHECHMELVKDSLTVSLDKGGSK